MDVVVEADRLGKRYGSAWALRDCSLHLPAGRIAALVGPNGAGKSTLLHLAVGLLKPDAGAVRVFGRSPYGDTEGHPAVPGLHRRRARRRGRQAQPAVGCGIGP